MGWETTPNITMAKEKKIKQLEVKEVKATFTVAFKKKFQGCFNNFEIDAKPGDTLEVTETVYQWIKQFNVC